MGGELKGELQLTDGRERGRTGDLNVTYIDLVSRNKSYQNFPHFPLSMYLVSLSVMSFAVLIDKPMSEPVHAQ